MIIIVKNDFNIDFSKIPKNSRGHFKWSESEGLEINFTYKAQNYTFKIIKYNKEKQSVDILFNKKFYNIKATTLKNNGLNKLFNIITNDFKVDIGSHFKDNKRDLVILDREYRDRIDNKGNNKWYKYKCNKCGWDEGWIVESALILQKIGCSCCANRTVVEGINDIPTTDPWMIKYFQDGYDEAKKYTSGSCVSIYPICPDCNEIKNKPTKIYSIHNRKGIACSCSDGFSYGHKYVASLLKQLNLVFIQNCTPKWCVFLSYNNKLIETKGEYDFLIEDLKLIIEVDGGFHRKLNSLSGQTKKESQFIDMKKDELAKAHGYKVIRLYYDDRNMKIREHILNSGLADVFNLSKVDWVKCEEFALKNIIKEVCNYWNNNKNLMTSEIAEVFGLERTTIIKYLKKGTKAKWCYYDGKLEMKKSQKRTSLMNSRKIKVIKDNVVLGKFPSVKKLSDSSISVLGIKIIPKHITDRININSKLYGKDYKGFYFKEISMEEYKDEKYNVNI